MSIKSLICLDIHKHSSVPQDGFYFILFDINLKRETTVCMWFAMMMCNGRCESCNVTRYAYFIIILECAVHNLLIS